MNSLCWVDDCFTESCLVPAVIQSCYLFSFSFSVVVAVSRHVKMSELFSRLFSMLLKDCQVFHCILSANCILIVLALVVSVGRLFVYFHCILELVCI